MGYRRLRSGRHAVAAEGAFTRTPRRGQDGHLSGGRLDGNGNRQGKLVKYATSEFRRVASVRPGLRLRRHFRPEVRGAGRRTPQSNNASGASSEAAKRSQAHEGEQRGGDAALAPAVLLRFRRRGPRGRAPAIVFARLPRKRDAVDLRDATASCDEGPRGGPAIRRPRPRRKSGVGKSVEGACTYFIIDAVLSFAARPSRTQVMAGGRRIPASIHRWVVSSIDGVSFGPRRRRDTNEGRRTGPARRRDTREAASILPFLDRVQVFADLVADWLPAQAHRRHDAFGRQLEGQILENRGPA